MAEDTKAPAAAPATAPLTPQQQAVSTANVAQKDADQAKVNRTVVRASSPLVTNPAPAEPEVPVEKPPETLPATTIAEMAAGKAALEKNKPVAEALEEHRRRHSDQRQVATNPVDNTTRTAEVAPKV